MLFRLSWLLLRRAYHVPRDSKVALFPIHLDPPTIQHRELFRLLLGQSRTSESCHRYPDPSVSSASSSAESVCGHGEDSKGGASTGNGEVSGGRSPMGSFCDGSWYLDELENHLRASSQLTPFDDIIVIPNTRSPVTLQRSTHLAALAVLGTRGIPHVHVDFTALEHPDETMPTMYELVCRYQRSTIVHWLHDAFEMQQWYQFTEIQKRAPLLLLQTNSLPVSAMGQPQRWLSTSHGRRRMAVQSGDAAAPSGEWWLSAGGPGDAEVEVSRSYLTKNGSAWLSPSLLTSQQSLNMDVESQRPRGGQNDLAHAASWGGADKAPIGDDLVVNEDGSLRIDNATAATLEAMVRRESEHPSTDASQGCSGVECELSAVQADLEDMLRPSQVLPVSTNLDEDVEAQEAESWMEFEDEDFVRSTHEAAAMDGLASSEEVGHHPTVRDLIMELFPAQSRCSVFSDDTGDGKVEVVCEGMDTALGAESGGATSSPTTPIQAPAAVAELMTSVPKVEVHSITRSTGADVRQAIWEQELDTNTILSTSVARYVDSHMLYRDSRKSTNATFFGHGAAPPPPNSNSTGGRSSTTPPSTNAAHNGSSASGSTPRRVVAAKETATLGFQGAIPRLELHHDLGNPVACELYESLRIFECREDEEPDLIVPIGGDGYMMHCIRRNWRRFIPFFGVNAGHVGYLLNDRATLDELFSMPLKIHTTTMLYCEAERAPTISANGTVVKGEVLSELAFNDAWVERLSGQTALIRIMINGEERIQRLRGDGVLVATAAGSTAYSQALGASPVPVGAPLIQVVGSNVVSPAQWRPVHLDQEDQVEFEVLDHIKRPCRCFVDSVDVGNVTRMLVRSSRVALVSLAFSGSCDLSHKLYQVQFPKP